MVLRLTVTLLAAVAAALLLGGAPPGAEAQPTGKVSRVGYLSPFSPASEPVRPSFEAFHRGLRELGWIPGQNVSIEYRWAEEKYDRLPALAAELVRLNVDVIVAASLPAAFATKRATTTIPIVFVGLGDPVSTGLVAGLARPGGNVTGLSGLALELSGKRLELLKEVVPRLSRVALLANPAHPMAAPMIRETQTAARTVAVRLQILEVREPGEIAEAFVAMDRERPDALVVLQDPLFGSRRKEILSLVAERRLRAIYVEAGWVPAGGLMSYAPRTADMHRRAATYVDKILKGAKPGELPVAQPTKFELAINLKTATALGLTIRPALLLRADQVID
jgi:putative ABC transport system substrate-binding protein